VETLALIRLDGDMFDSTTVALESLYPKLSTGGYVIVDDYGAVAECAAATEAFRDKNGITDEITKIDWTGVYWRKS
jgi:O-methyltransferase